MKMNINEKKYYNDMEIIWDELFSYAYEIEEDYFDADIILRNKYDKCIGGIIYEYYE